MTHPPHRTPPSGEPTLRQSKSALLEAAQAAIADRSVERRGTAPGGERTRTTFRSVLAVLLVSLSAVLAIRPAWLAGPRLPAETEAVKVASATLALVEAVSHVKAYLATAGRLPPRLRDAGVINEAIVLKAVGRSEFEVSLRAGDSVVAIRSSDSLKAAVVNAIITLQRRT